MTKVSILVPIYNVETYLKECLDSIINQTLQDIEIICLNDGSTDNCLNILQEYQKKDNRIKIVNKENSGYGASMNIGIQIAKGEYIGIVEPDDYCDINMFHDLYEIAKKNAADLVKSNWISLWTKPKYRILKSDELDKYSPDFIFNVKTEPNIMIVHPSIWSAIYRREFLLKENIRFLETPGASFQDVSFAFKTKALAKKMVMFSNSYYYYRQDNINSSINSSKNIFKSEKEYEEILRFLDEHNELKNLKIYHYINMYRDYIYNLVKFPEEFYDLIIDKFSSEFKDLYYSGKISNDFFEIRDAFFKGINKEQFFLLINNKEEFKQKIKDKVKRKQLREKIKKFISLRIRKTGFRLSICGKEIMKSGKL